MRYLGIDYGTKKVGIAISNETNEFSLPLLVLPNDSKLFSAIKKIILEKEVGEIVLGESKNYKGEDNVVMEEINKFKIKLEKETGLKVLFEPEFMTSAQADRAFEVRNLKPREKGDGPRPNQRRKSEMLDASAAALILKSHLDRITN